MKRIPLNKPYMISLIIHLSLLLLLSLWKIIVEDPQKWYEFEWLSRESYIGSVAPAAAGKDTAEDAIADIPQTDTESSVSSEDFIEQPSWDSTDNNVPNPNTNVIRSDLSTTIHDSGLPRGGSSSGLSLDLTQGGGDAYFIRESLPDISPLMDDTVVVEFSLNRDGSVRMNSVKVISYRRAEHWRALRDAMRSWRFGFTGGYNPNNVYRISCRFTIK